MPTLQWLGRMEAMLAAERVPFRVREHGESTNASSMLFTIWSKIRIRAVEVGGRKLK